MAGNAETGDSLKRRSPGVQARASDNEFNFEEENVMTNNTTVVDMRQFVQARNGQAFTTSQRVAEAFNKQHKHVLEKVRSLECSDQFLTANFSAVQFDHRGNTYEAYEMTKDGFMFLVMGFTGKKAAAVKEGYIAAFNWMAEQLGLNATDLVGAVIGSSGLTVLDRVIDQKAGVIEKGLRRSFKMTIKSRLRGRFNVQRTDLIPADNLADACNFVAGYALEGEWLAKEAEPVFDDWLNLNCLITCMQRSYEVFAKHNLYSHLTGLGSRSGIEIIDYLADGRGVAGMLKREYAEPLTAALNEARGICDRALGKHAERVAA